MPILLPRHACTRCTMCVAEHFSCSTAISLPRHAPRVDYVCVAEQVAADVPFFAAKLMGDAHYAAK